MSTPSRLLIISDVVLPPERIREEIRQANVTVATDNVYPTVAALVPNARIERLSAFRRIANVQRACDLTVAMSKITLPDGRRLPSVVREGDYELWWMNNKTIYSFFIMPYLEYEPFFTLIMEAETVALAGAFRHQELLEDAAWAAGTRLEYVGTTKAIDRMGSAWNPRALIMSFVQMFVTIISLLILVFRRPPVGIWTADILTRPFDYDFRYQDLYKELRASKLRFVEFLRLFGTSKTFFRNLARRRRPALYYESFTRPLKAGLTRQALALEQKVVASLPAPNPATRRERFLTLLAMKAWPDCLAQQRLIPVLRHVLRLVGTKALFVPGAYGRGGALIIAAKQVGIKSVDLMHTPYMRSFHPEEAGVGFDGPRSHAVDYFGVWSDFWVRYYQQERAFYGQTALFPAGHLRTFPRVEPAHQQAHGQPIRVLLVSEPLVDPAEIVAYLRPLLNDPRFRLAIKCRPERNDTILKELGDVGQRLHLFFGRMEDAFAESDVVIGAHSTGLVEALYFYKPIVMLATQKWGDYFEVQKNAIAPYVETPTALPDAILAAATLPPAQLRERRAKIWGDSYRNGPRVIVRLLEKLCAGESFTLDNLSHD